MDKETTSSFNEGQYKRLGMLDALTENVKQQMQDGAPLIQAALSKEFDGNKVNATLYSKKSATSDYYFINKFDLNIELAGSDKTIKQTFYVNNKKNEGEKPDINYTLKKAYNFLAGRPVYHSENQSWEQIDFKRTLENGNYAKNRFDKNYGFDLKGVVAQYSIVERGNENHLKQLIDSLERGNLQKAKFVDQSGKVEELYISPSIKTSSFHLYDKDRKPVSLETQIERQYISIELAEKLKVLFKEKLKEEPQQVQKQQVEQTQKELPKQTQKAEAPKKVQKQKQDKEVKKRTTKQKVG